MRRSDRNQPPPPGGRSTSRRRLLRRPVAAGESLIELLVTVAVIGITVPAVMGAVLFSVSASSQDRRQVQAQALLSTWAETIARENGTDADYTGFSCTAAPTYYATGRFAPPGLPTGFTATVVKVSYWDKASLTFLTPCPGTADAGARKLDLKVTVVAQLLPGFDATQSIVVRKPCLTC